MVLGHTPRRSRRQLGDLADEYGEADPVRVGGRQGDLYPSDHLGHTGRDLDQAKTDRIELGVAPEGGAGCQPAQGQQQPIGGGVEQQPELVSGGLGARRTIGGEVELVRLDQVFGLPARAVEFFVEGFGQSRQVGDDEAAVSALGSGLDAGDDGRSTFQLFAA